MGMNRREKPLSQQLWDKGKLLWSGSSVSKSIVTHTDSNALLRKKATSSHLLYVQLKKRKKSGM